MSDNRWTLIALGIAGVVLIAIAHRLLRRAREVAARLLPGPRGRLGPPPRQARHRRRCCSALGAFVLAWFQTGAAHADGGLSAWSPLRSR